MNTRLLRPPNGPSSTPHPGARMRSRVCHAATTAAGALACVGGLAGAAEAAVPHSAVDALYVQNGSSGTYDGKRLTLNGVHPTTVWFADRPARSWGVTPIREALRELFEPRQPPPNAALDLGIAGSRSASANGIVALRLSRPRYDRRTQTITYRATRLHRLEGTDLAHRSDDVHRGRVPRRFGRAALFIDDAEAIFNKSCSTTFANDTSFAMPVGGSSKWDTDSWTRQPPSPGPLVVLTPTQSMRWASEGGSFRGCSNTMSWTIDDATPPTSVTVTTTYPYGGTPSSQCRVSSSRYLCSRVNAVRTSGTYDVTWTLTGG